MEQESRITYHKDPTFTIIEHYEILRNSIYSEKWEEYNKLRKYLYSIKYNFKTLVDHLNKINHLNLIGINGSKRWKQQRVTHCLIGNLIASLQSVFEVFKNTKEIQSIRNSNLGQFLRTLRNYHIHRKHISTSMNMKSIKHDNQVVTTWDENIQVETYLIYLNTVIDEANKKQQNNIIPLLRSLYQYIESNFEKSIPLISIIHEVTLNTISNAENYLFKMAIENKNEIQRLISLFTQFVNIKKQLGEPNFLITCDLKLRYLRIANTLIKNNE
jgi:hypothetical protein